MDSAFAFGDLNISSDGSVKPLLPKAKDFTHHLTLTAKNRQANSLKELYKYASESRSLMELARAFCLI